MLVAVELFDVLEQLQGDTLGNKKKPEICCTATHQTLSLTFHKIHRNRDLLNILPYGEMI